MSSLQGLVGFFFNVFLLSLSQYHFNVGEKERKLSREFKGFPLSLYNFHLKFNHNVCALFGKLNFLVGMQDCRVK